MGRGENWLKWVMTNHNLPELATCWMKTYHWMRLLDCLGGRYQIFAGGILVMFCWSEEALDCVKYNHTRLSLSFVVNYWRSDRLTEERCEYLKVQWTNLTNKKKKKIVQSLKNFYRVANKGDKPFTKLPPLQNTNCIGKWQQINNIPPSTPTP